MLLPASLGISLRGGSGDITVAKTVLWERGATIKISFLDGAASLRRRVANAASLWEEFANIRFAFGRHLRPDVRISFDADPGSWSYVGTTCHSVDRSEPTMNFGWLHADSSDMSIQSVVLHEFGHALGLLHEHQHTNATIPWDETAVYDYYERHFGWNRDKTYQNFFERLDEPTTHFGTYDANSIMHYGVPDEFTVGNFEIPWNHALSPIDKLGIAHWYPAHSLFSVETIDGHSTAESLAAEGDFVLWKERGIRELKRGRVVDGELAQVKTIDGKCDAEMIAAAGDYVYWKDVGSMHLKRGKVVDGELQGKTIDHNCVAEAIAAEGDYVLWKERGLRDLKRGEVVDGKLTNVKTIDDRCDAAMIAAAGDYVYWKDRGTTKLIRGTIAGGEFVQTKTVDPNCTAEMISAEGEYVLWKDWGKSSLLRGRIL